jgi:hypothetical protein
MPKRTQPMYKIMKLFITQKKFWAILNLFLFILLLSTPLAWAWNIFYYGAGIKACDQMIAECHTDYKEKCGIEFN